MLTIQAPAKLNLSLEVIGKRRDGYHEIRSVVQTVSFYDCLKFKTGRGIKIKCNMPGWDPEQSLVDRAVKLVQQETGYAKGVTIEVEKRIPLMSGLGGDSSDAAAVLRGLNEVWKLGLSPEKLLELALSLGSDVPFFLYGGTALVQGRGEIVAPLPPVSKKWVVLVMPDVPQEPGKTGQMYASLKTAHFTDGHITRRLVEVLGAHRELKTSMMFNTFENIAFNKFSVLSVYKDHIRKLGAFRVHLAGSGPTLFAVFRDRRKADDLCTKCRNQGMESYLVETIV